MSSPETVEQVILALPCDGATTLAIIGALKEAGLADATVYAGPGTTVSVVTKELREQAVADLHDAVGIEYDEVGHIERVTFDADAALDDTLSTVLGKTRVARAVGKFRAGNRETGEAAWLDIPEYGVSTWEEMERMPDIEEFAAIAILEDDDE